MLREWASNAGVVIQYTDRGNVRTIASLRTPTAKLRQGHARRAMEAFIADADAEGLTLELGASPLNKSTSLGRLVRFYESLGFRQTGRSVNPLGHPMMRREPSPAEVERMGTSEWSWSAAEDELFLVRPGRAVDGQGITTYAHELGEHHEVRILVGPAEEIAAAAGKLVLRSRPAVVSWATTHGFSRLGFLDWLDVPRGTGDRAMREIEHLGRLQGVEGFALALTSPDEHLERFFTRHGLASCTEPRPGRW